jgi:hypothetical protein
MKLQQDMAKIYGRWYKTDRCEIETQSSKLIIRSKIYDNGISLKLFYLLILSIVIFIWDNILETILSPSSGINLLSSAQSIVWVPIRSQTSSIEWAQLSIFSPEDGDRIVSEVKF